MRYTLYICVLAFAAVGCGKTEIEKVRLTELSGEPLNMSSLRGKTVFVNFWATWCGPCIQEMPTIEQAQQSLKGREVIFLMASNEEIDEIEAFAKRKSYDFHYVRLLNMEELKIPALPTTYIFNGDGNLKFSETGMRDWNEPENLKLITQ